MLESERERPVKRIPNGGRAIYRPRQIMVLDGRYGTQWAGHTGTVIDYTTDGFYRIIWDKPNPAPDFFNLETVFCPEDVSSES